VYENSNKEQQRVWLYPVSTSETSREWSCYGSVSVWFAVTGL